MMNKAILLSVRPEHLVNILNGYKTLELRKNVPKDYKGWVYIYCTKGGGLLVDNTSWINFLIKGGFVKKDYTESPRFHTLKKLEEYMYGTVRNTKVVARFWFDEYEKISLELVDKSGYDEDKLKEYESENMSNDELQQKLCLDEVEIDNYLNSYDGYAWHIKQLEIFDTPLSLSDFYKATLYASGEVIKEYEKQTNDFSYKLKRPPQSWQYVWVE
jgi:predicted transcriptional regulator